MPEDERRRPGRGFGDPLARPAPHLRRRPGLNVMRSHRRLDGMGKLDGKIALVTGASSGIGLAAYCCPRSDMRTRNASLGRRSWKWSMR